MYRFDIPSVVQAEVTYNCDHNCLFCYNPAGSNDNCFRSQAELTTKDWKSIFKRLKREGVLHILFTGGEPLLRKDIDVLVKHVITLGMSVTINTNGDNISEKRAALYEKSGINLNISMQSNNPEVHDFLVGVKGSFRRLLDAYDILQNRDIVVSFNTTLTKYNCSGLEHTIQFVIGDLGANFTATRFIAKSRCQRRLEPDNNQLKKAMSTITRARTRYGNRVKLLTSIPFCFDDSMQYYGTCTAGLTWCTISPYGRVRPCTHSISEVGNIKEDTLKHIWDSEQMKMWLHCFNKSCEKCKIFNECKGGCRALAEIAGKQGDLLIRKPIDKITNKNSAPFELTQQYKFIEKPRCRRMDDGNYLIFTLGKSFVLNRTGFQIVKRFFTFANAKDILADDPKATNEISALMSELISQGVLESRNTDAPVLDYIYRLYRKSNVKVKDKCRSIDKINRTVPDNALHRIFYTQ